MLIPSLDWLWQLLGMIRNHVPLEGLPNGTATAWVAIIAGLLLSLWGARLLRGIFVLILLSVGAAIGMRVAIHSQVEPLLGLVLGGAMGGFFGHLFYRWSLMVMSGACAVLFVASIGGAKVLPAEIQGYHDHIRGMDTGSYAAALAAADRQAQRPLQATQEYLQGAWHYAWNERPKLVQRWSVALVLAVILGMAAGLLLPRFTTIMGTSIIGVLLWISGCCWLIANYAPSAWASIQAHSGWLLAFAVLALVVSISIQLRGGRKIAAVVPVEAAPVPVSK